MFNKEEEKTVISMDMGGKIEPVELPKEEEIKEAVEETKSTVVPQLMQIDTAKDEVPQIVDAIKVVEVPKPTPTIGEVKPTPTPAPAPKPVPTITEVKPPVVEEKKEEVKEEPKVEYGPNVISEPLAKEDNNKEKKKNPHFLECPPNCKPIRPMGYIILNILYMIPVIGLIFILAHSASYKNLNRRNYARSYLIAIFLIILIIFALIYFLKIDFIGIIENIIGYKIDLQHFKFIKFK